ncbi:MAG TPA: CvpA family protein [Flavobacterium sp.]|nr:CvpA family protein [Flavobacterium sp.]
MNFIDIIIATILAFGLIRGAWNGFFVELASFVSLIIGVFIAIKFSGFVADYIRENLFSESQYIEIIAFAITFILVIVGIVLLAKTFTKLASFTGLGWINRLLGGVFGLLKMLFIVSIVLHFFQKINKNDTLITEQSKQDSVLYAPVVKASELVFPILTDWFAKVKEGAVHSMSDPS